VKIVIELSGENPELATAEAESVLRILGGSYGGPEGLRGYPRASVAANVPDDGCARQLAARLALSHRVLRWVATGDAASLIEAAVGAASVQPGPARFDWIEARPNSEATLLDSVANAYRGAGGTIRLRDPSRTFFLTREGPGRLGLLEVVARTGRRALRDRALPTMPFQRPVTLAPRLARAAANLAGIRAGDRVADPFLGTGSLLLEAGLLGAELYGSDLDATMVRGAARNLAEFGVSPTALSVADAADAVSSLPWGEVDAVLTDPPYGRASSTRGEATDRLLDRVLPIWADRVRRGGRLVVIGPGGGRSLPRPWLRKWSIPDRVHRSLTRVFEVWQRGSDEPASQ
jgi:tRNA (guanine10-N2)-dimethyltransferase